jgi:hypothetical protein
MLYGLGILLEGWLAFTSIVHTLFHFPIILGTILVMLAINFSVAPPLSAIAKEGKKIKKFAPIVSYTILGVLVFLYAQYCDKIF